MFRQEAVQESSEICLVEGFVLDYAGTMGQGLFFEPEELAYLSRGGFHDAEAVRVEGLHLHPFGRTHHALECEIVYLIRSLAEVESGYSFHEAASHLFGRISGKGQHHDVVLADIVSADEIQAPLHHRLGLSCSGTCVHYDHALGTIDYRFL